MSKTLPTLVNKKTPYSRGEKKAPTKPFEVIIIGLGEQTRKDHIPAILARKDLKIVALVDKNMELLSTYGKMTGAHIFDDARSAISTIKPDMAIVSVPHNEYFGILEVLAENNVATLKEKPLAMTYDEATKIIDLYKSHDTYLQICVQRRFSKLYETTKQLLDSIGKIYSVYVEYTLSLRADDMASGWRADKKISGGGAALDLGYHSVDLLTYIFGVPDKVYAQLSYNSLGDGYSIEDTMKAMMNYRDGQINTNIVVTKIFNQKSEKVWIFGSNGSVHVDGRTVILRDKDGNEIESHSFSSKQQEVELQLDHFIDKSTKNTEFNAKDQNLVDQLTNMRTIDAIYKSHSSEKTIKLR
jgi:predicted dehydrogenase